MDSVILSINRSNHDTIKKDLDVKRLLEWMKLMEQIGYGVDDIKKALPDLKYMFELNKSIAILTNNNKKLSMKGKMVTQQGLRNIERLSVKFPKLRFDAIPYTGYYILNCKNGYSYEGITITYDMETSKWNINGVNYNGVESEDKKVFFPYLILRVNEQKQAYIYVIDNNGIYTEVNLNIKMKVMEKFKYLANEFDIAKYYVNSRLVDYLREFETLSLLNVNPTLGAAAGTTAMYMARNLMENVPIVKNISWNDYKIDFPMTSDKVWPYEQDKKDKLIKCKPLRPFFRGWTYSVNGIGYDKTFYMAPRAEYFENVYAFPKNLLTLDNGVLAWRSKEKSKKKIKYTVNEQEEDVDVISYFEVDDFAFDLKSEMTPGIDISIKNDESGDQAFRRLKHDPADRVAGTRDPSDLMIKDQVCVTFDEQPEITINGQYVIEVGIPILGVGSETLVINIDGKDISFTPSVGENVIVYRSNLIARTFKIEAKGERTKIKRMKDENILMYMNTDGVTTESDDAIEEVMMLTDGQKWLNNGTTYNLLWQYKQEVVGHNKRAIAKIENSMEALVDVHTHTLDYNQHGKKIIYPSTYMITGTDSQLGEIEPIEVNPGDILESKKNYGYFYMYDTQNNWVFNAGIQDVYGIVNFMFNGAVSGSVSADNFQALVLPNGIYNSSDLNHKMIEFQNDIIRLFGLTSDLQRMVNNNQARIDYLSKFVDELADKMSQPEDPLKAIGEAISMLSMAIDIFCPPLGIAALMLGVGLTMIADIKDHDYVAAGMDFITILVLGIGLGKKLMKKRAEQKSKRMTDDVEKMTPKRLDDIDLIGTYEKHTTTDDDLPPSYNDLFPDSEHKNYNYKKFGDGIALDTISIDSDIPSILDPSELDISTIMTDEKGKIKMNKWKVHWEWNEKTKEISKWEKKLIEFGEDAPEVKEEFKAMAWGLNDIRIRKTTNIKAKDLSNTILSSYKPNLASPATKVLGTFQEEWYSLKNNDYFFNNLFDLEEEVYQACKKFCLG